VHYVTIIRNEHGNGARRRREKEDTTGVVGECGGCGLNVVFWCAVCVVAI
jgi:hypothetical protein